MKKRYWLIGGLIGVIIAIILSIYFGVQIKCAGLYLNSDGTFGTVCPKVDIFKNLYSSINYEFITIATLFLSGALLGWLYGKFKSKKLIS